MTVIRVIITVSVLATICTVPGVAAGARLATPVQVASWVCSQDLGSSGGRFLVRDLDGDGHPELAYSFRGDTTYVRDSNGDNLFPLVHRLAHPVNPTQIATELVGVGDGDQDGLAEFIYGSGTAGVPRNLLILESPAAGQYPSALVATLPEMVIPTTYLVEGDQDGDGRREYICTTEVGHEALMAVWENRGDNAYEQVFSSNYVGDSRPAVLGDFDGDGIRDILVPRSSLDSMLGEILILESTGDDQYAQTYTGGMDGWRLEWLTEGPDLDRDGRLDFIGCWSQDYLYWNFTMFEGTGSDDNYRAVWSRTYGPAQGSGGLATGDVDGDGWNELLLQYPGHTLLFRGAGNNQLQEEWSLDGPFTGSRGQRIIAPDLDGDGRGEMIWWTGSHPATAVVYELPDPMAAIDDSDGGRSPAGALTVVPNPARGRVGIRFTQPREGTGLLSVYDTIGRKVASLDAGRCGPGDHTLLWDAGRLPGGVYFLRLDSEPRAAQNRLIIAR